MVVALGTDENNSPTVVNSSLRSNCSIAAPESDSALLNRLKDEESSALVPLEKSVKLHRIALCLLWSRICRNLNLVGLLLEARS